MLKDPPCIFPLVGCSTSDTSVSREEDSQSSSLIADTEASSSSRSSIFTNSSSSSSGFTSSSSSTNGTFTSRFSSDAERVATYVVTAINSGTDVVENFSFVHGPTPSGAIFDSVRSSGECVQTGISVQCTSDLEDGDVKTFTIAYTVNNAVSCSLARGLQVVEVQSSTASVSTSVGCAMTNENASQASSAWSSSFFSSSEASMSSEPLYDAAGVADAYAVQQYASGSVVGGQVVMEQVKDDGKGKGKGYKPYPEPRAGAISDYFMRTTEASLLTPVSKQNTEDGLAISFVSVLFLSTVFLVIIGFTLFRNKFASRDTV